MLCMVQLSYRCITVFAKLDFVGVDQFSVLSETYFKSSALEHMKQSEAQKCSHRLV